MKTSPSLSTRPSNFPAKPGSKCLPACAALLALALFTACQPGLPGYATPTPSATATVFTRPPIRATFTDLPGDMSSLYQTLTAAPATYPPVFWKTSAPSTATPQYTLTAIELAPTAGMCVLAYPDFCVSPNVRIGCTELRSKGKHDFTVLDPDPYGYDRNDNGIGCEVGE